MRSSLFFATAALALAIGFAQAKAQPVQLCTGGQDGVYYTAGQSIRDTVSGRNYL